MRSYQKNKKSKKDKKAPIKYLTNFKSKDLETVTLKFKDEDDEEVKETIPVFADGSDEAFLYAVNEFQNVIDTYDLFQSDGNSTERQKAARKVFSKFRRVLRGNARDTWQSILDEANDVWSEKEFYDCSAKFISEILGEFPYKNQVDYLKRTAKSHDLSAKKWINRIKFINAHLPLMKDKGKKLSEEELIENVITDNIPDEWSVFFKAREGHRKNKIAEVLTILLDAEEEIPLSKGDSGNDHGGENKSGKLNNNKRKNRDNSSKGNSNKQEDKDNSSTFSNPCKFKTHNHEKSACKFNSKSSNFCGEKRSYVKEQKKMRKNITVPAISKVIARVKAAVTLKAKNFLKPKSAKRLKKWKNL